MPIPLPVVQTGLEKSIDLAAKKAGKNLRINMGPGAKSIESLSKPLGRLTGRADEFTKSMEAANARVLAFGASVGVIAAVSNGFRELVKTTIQVEKSLANINSILKQSESQLSSFKNTIFDVARNTEQTFDTVAEAALELSRQGLKAEEVTKRLNDALVLSRLSGLSAADSVSGLTAAINSFSSAGLTSSEVLNKISAAAASAAVSDRDLIEGLKRSGSVAVAAGVQFDELVGIISALQERTARGGSVIGNSLKTIFTRIQDLDRLQTLQNLGVQVTDLGGQVLASNKIIENLAPTFAKLGQAAKVNLADELVGKFQIAPFLALLEDYNQKISRSSEVATTSFNATNEAYERNAALNQTLATAINTAVVNLKELGNTLGEIGVTDNLKNILDFFNSLVSNIKGVLDGEGVGADLAKGVVKGLGAVLSGPGLALVGAVIGKLLIDFGKFGMGALKTFFGLNKAAERQASLQGQITATLLNDKQIRQDILNIENQSISAEEKRRQQAEYFETALREQLSIMQQMQGIAATITPSVMTATAPLRGKKGKKAAGGFLPIGAEKSDIARGVGGAPSSAKPVVIPNFAFGGGQRGTMVANTSEYIVPNYANGGDAIFNQNMVSSMGLPANARKVRAASGYIPNFAQATYDDIASFSRAYDLRKIERSAPSVFFKADGSFKNPKLGILAKQHPNSPHIEAVLGKRRKAFNANTPLKSVMLVPQPMAFDPSGANHNFQSPYKGYDTFLGGVAGINPNLDEKNSKFYKLLQLDAALDSSLTDGVNQALNKTISSSKGSLKANPKSYSTEEIKKIILQEGGAGAFGALRGAVFEAIINAVSGGLKTEKGGTLDVLFDSNRTVLEEIFGVEGMDFHGGDFKNSLNQRTKYAKQIINNKAVFNKAAAGYIPNFAQGALEEAIGREQSAGLPISQIRINQSGKLRNSQNPMGLAVTNTRDEPTGAIPNFAETYRDPITGRFAKRPSSVGLPQQPLPQDVRSAGGLPPAVIKQVEDLGDAASETSKAQNNSLGIIFGVQAGLTALSAATKDSESSVARYTSIVSESAAAATSYVFAGQAVSEFGDGLKGSKPKIGAFVSGLGTLGMGVGLAIEGFNLFKNLYNEFSGENKRAANSLANLADVSKTLAVSFDGLSEVEKTDITQAASEVVGFGASKTVYTGAYGMAATSYQTDVNRGFSNEEVEKGFKETAQKFLLMGKTVDEVDTMLDVFGQNLDAEELKKFTNGLKEANAEFVKRKEATANVLSGFSDKQLKGMALGKAPDRYTAEELGRIGLPMAQVKIEARKELGKREAKKEQTQEGIKTLNAQQAKAMLDTQLKLAELRIQEASEDEQKLNRAKIIGNLAGYEIRELEKKVELQKIDQGFGKEAISIIRGRLEQAKGIVLEEGKVNNLMSEIGKLSLKDLHSKDKVQGVLENIEGLTKDEKVLYENLVKSVLEQYEGAKLVHEETRGAKEAALDLEAAAKGTSENFKEAAAQAQHAAQMLKLSTMGGIAADRAAIEAKSQRAGRTLSAGGLTLGESESLAKTQKQLNLESARLKLRELDADYAEKITNLNIQIANANGDDKKNLLRQVDEAAKNLELQKSLAKYAIERAEAELNIVTAMEKANNELARLNKASGASPAMRFQAQMKVNALTKFPGLTEAEAVARYEETMSADEYRRSKYTYDAAKSASDLGKRLVDASETFRENFAKAFAEGIDSVDSLKDALLNVANTYIKSIAQAHLQNFTEKSRAGGGSGIFSSIASFFGFSDGGKVNGGSGSRDDVPAMLMGGEYVINKKAVSKYGVGFMEALNSGSIRGYASGGQVRDREGMFTTPGVNGAGAIVGGANLMSYATQTPIALGRDTITGYGGFLGSESGRMTMFGRRNNPEFQNVQAAKRQAFDLAIKEEEAYAQAAAQKTSLGSMLASAAISTLVGYGASQLTGSQLLGSGLGNIAGTLATGAPSSGGAFGAAAIEDGAFTSLFSSDKASKAIWVDSYGNPIHRATGGLIPSQSGVDTVPAMLSGGEFVMNAAATKNIGVGNLQALNSGAGTGDNSELVSKLDELIRTTENSQSTGEINITINGSTGSESQTTGQESTEQQRNLSEKIKTAVKQVLADEQRLGGQLRR